MSQYRENSPPLRVEWGPWRSDIMALQRCGWQVVMDQESRMEYFDEHYRVLIRDPNTGMIGYAQFTGPNRHDGLDNSNWHRGLVIRFDLYADYSKVAMHTGLRHVWDPVGIGRNSERYAAVDCTPTMVTIGELINPHQIFKNAPIHSKDEQEIVVKEESIIELLGRIKEMQQPEQDRIREDNNSRIIIPKVHAKIITLDSKR